MTALIKNALHATINANLALMPLSASPAIPPGIEILLPQRVRAQPASMRMGLLHV